MDSELWIFNRPRRFIYPNSFNALVKIVSLSCCCGSLFPIVAMNYTWLILCSSLNSWEKIISFLILISFWINVLILVLLVTNHPSKQRKFNKIFLLSRFNVQIHPLIFRMVGRSPSQVSNSRSYGMPRISTCLEDSEFAHAWEFRPPAYTQDGVSLVTAHIGILESI